MQILFRRYIIYPMSDSIRLHYRQIRRILLGILFLNWGVALAKILYGWHSRSSSITADGFHSLSDGASNIIGVVGISIACQPRDKEHPYGHKKYETFFSLGISILLFILSFTLIKKGIGRLYNPVIPRVDLLSFVVMLTTLAVNLWVVNFESRKGRVLKSDILTSDAMHTKADIFTSLSVIFALIAIKLGYPILDPIATLLISLFIAYSAIDIARDSARVLCDTVADLDIKDVKETVLSVKGVRACHKIRSRGRPDDIHIDLHVIVDPRMNMENAHQISDSIEAALKKRIPAVTDVLIHMEPKEKKRPTPSKQ